MTTVGLADFNIDVGMSLLFVTCQPYSVWSGIFCWDRCADLLMMICMKALRTCCTCASSVGGRQRRSPLK